MINNQSNEENIELTVVFDNVRYLPHLQTKWGYSCVVKSGKDLILFDTGSSGEILLKNMSQLQIDPNSIISVVISHNHWDHLDGLVEFLKVNQTVTVYIPNSSLEKIEQDILKTGAKVVRVESFLKIADNIFSLGELDGKLPEQSIAIKTKKGIVFVTGCAHPGIVNIIKHARSIFSEDPIYLVMGGFHLKDDNSEKITQTVKTIFDLKVERIAPSHCTCEKAINEFEKIYKNNYIKSGVGKKIIIKGGE